MKYDFTNQSHRVKFYNSSEWRGVNGVRKKVLARDNNECQWCKSKGLIQLNKLEVDHIIELEYGTYKDALDMNNLRTLCRSCHNERHNRFDGVKFKPNRFHEDERW